MTRPIVVRPETTDEMYARLMKYLRIRECWGCIECFHNGELDGCLYPKAQFPEDLSGCEFFELDDDAHENDRLPVACCDCEHCERRRRHLRDWSHYLFQRKIREAIDLSKRQRATKAKQRKRRKRRLKTEARLQRGALKRARRAPIAKRRGASP